MAAREAAEASDSCGCPYERFVELLRRSREVKSTWTYEEAEELLGSSPCWQEVPDEGMRRFGFDLFVNKLRELEDKRSQRRRAERLAVERAASACASLEEECAASEVISTESDSGESSSEESLSALRRRGAQSKARARLRRTMARSRARSRSRRFVRKSKLWVNLKGPWWNRLRTSAAMHTHRRRACAEVLQSTRSPSVQSVGRLRLGLKRKSSRTGAAEHTISIRSSSESDCGEENGVAEREEKNDADNKQAEEIWMASQTLWTVAQVLRAFAMNEKACSSESHDMPNDFVARMRECDVEIPDVADVMNRAVNALCECRLFEPTGATEQGRSAMMMKEPDVIQASWKRLFKIRRTVEKDDMKLISDENVCIDLHDMWMSTWLYENLTNEQRTTITNRTKTSMFEAWLTNEYGSKRFVMAIIETGVSSATPSGVAEHISPYTDMPVGAPEHTMSRCMKWILKVVKVIGRQKNNLMVQAGFEKNSSGLAQEEEELRAARDQARAEIEYGAFLNRRLELREGKGRSKGKRDKWLWPIEWNELSRKQKWYVCEFRNGDLMKAKEAAEEEYEQIWLR